MKTRFLGQAYQSRSPILSSQTAINVYPEGTEGNADEVGCFIGTPGLIKVAQPAVAAVRGVHEAGGALYAVVGSGVYRLSSAFDWTLLGRITSNAGSVSMADNGTQLLIAHPNGMHWVNLGLSGRLIAPVVNGRAGAIVTAMDDYVIFTTNSGGEFGITALDDLSSIDPLDVATAEGAPDDLVSVLADHREVWLFGTETIEIWSDTGAAFFPFERSPGGFIEQGCAAMYSPAQLDNSVFWLGRDGRGQGVVYRANAYIPTRISTHAIEYAINQYPRIVDAIGFAYQEEGHTFYWLTFPSAPNPRGGTGVSWVYDVAAGGWHQRAWLDHTTGDLHRHRANCHAYFAGHHIVGDFENGKIYALSLDAYSDDGDEIYRERAWDLPDSEHARIRVDLLELLAVQGDGASGSTTVTTLSPGTWDWSSTAMTWDSTVYFCDGTAPAAVNVQSTSDFSGAKVWLEISRDAGRRFGFKRVIHLGALGQTQARARWRRCATGRDLVARVCTTMSNRVQWMGCNIHAEALGT